MALINDILDLTKVTAKQKARIEETVLSENMRARHEESMKSMKGLQSYAIRGRLSLENWS